MILNLKQNFTKNNLKYRKIKENNGNFSLYWMEPNINRDVIDDKE